MHLTPDKWKNNHRFLPQEVKKNFSLPPEWPKHLNFQLNLSVRGKKRAEHVPGAGKEYIYHTSTSSTTLNKKIFYDFLKGIDFPLTRSIFYQCKIHINTVCTKQREVIQSAVTHKMDKILIKWQEEQLANCFLLGHLWSTKGFMKNSSKFMVYIFLCAKLLPHKQPIQAIIFFISIRVLSQNQNIYLHEYKWTFS